MHSIGKATEYGQPCGGIDGDRAASHAGRHRGRIRPESTGGAHAGPLGDARPIWKLAEMFRGTAEASGLKAGAAYPSSSDIRAETTAEIIFTSGATA